MENLPWTAELALLALIVNIPKAITFVYLLSDYPYPIRLSFAFSSIQSLYPVIPDTRLFSMPLNSAFCKQHILHNGKNESLKQSYDQERFKSRQPAVPQILFSQLGTRNFSSGAASIPLLITTAADCANFISHRAGNEMMRNWNTMVPINDFNRVNNRHWLWIVKIADHLCRICKNRVGLWTLKIIIIVISQMDHLLLCEWYSICGTL
ncbi:hypothetical protein SAMN03159341_111164 [Paenibacillus sp. 1_12]|nr:hypothetical protein SAMN03159341_111164 [Paenibacillus sp. 1_12]